MAGIPFLHNIDLNENQLLNAKLHTSGTAPSSPGTGTIWYDSTNDKVKVYDTNAWYTVGNTTEEIQDIVGAMFSSNTETGIAVTYEDGDGTIDLVVDNATSITVADTTDTSCFVGLWESATGNLAPKTDAGITYNAGTGILTATGFSGPLTGNVTGNVSGSLIIGGHTVDDIDITSEASNADDHLMTALAIKNRIEDYSYITASSSDTLTNKTIAASQVTEISNLSAVEGAQLENIDSTTISATQWGYLGAATGAITNTNDDVSIPNLKIALAGGFASNAVTIGDSDDVVTIGKDLIITGDLTVSGDTISANVATLNVEDKNITLNYSSSDSSSTASGAGLTIQDAVDSSTDATMLWDASNDEFDFSHAINVTGNITVSGTVDGIDIATDVTANNAKNTNVSTNLGVSTSSTTLDVTSSDGTNATLPVATTSAGGVMSAAQVTTLNATQTAGNVGTLIDARSSAHTITGDNSETEFTITYGFTAAAINDVMIQVVCSYATDTDHDGDTVYTETERHSTTQCKIKFATAPGTGHTYRVLCFKIA